MAFHAPGALVGTRAVESTWAMPVWVKLPVPGAPALFILETSLGGLAHKYTTDDPCRGMMEKWEQTN